MLSRFERLAAEAVPFIHKTSDSLRRNSTGTVPKAVALWGGGKDSTLALMLAKAISEMVPLDVIAITMDNPGMSPDTLANISRLANSIDLRHELWHFNNRTSSLDSSRESRWNTLYNSMYQGLHGHQRFMCVACNLAANTVEFSALAHHRAAYLITGNPTWELQSFANWAKNIMIKCPCIAAPLPTAHSHINYYLSWHSIYSAMLMELFNGDSDALLHYLYPKPSLNDLNTDLQQLPLLGPEHSNISLESHHALISELGWSLPSDIMGGTESDCTMTAAISALDIQRHGLDSHLSRIRDAALKFTPFTEMTIRASEWASSGRSTIEGIKLLNSMGINQSTAYDRNLHPVTMAVAEQLHPIR